MGFCKDGKISFAQLFKYECVKRVLEVQIEPKYWHPVKMYRYSTKRTVHSTDIVITKYYVNELKYIIISSSETSEQTGKHVTCKKSSEISSSGNGVQSSSRLTMQKAEQSIQFIMRLSCAVYTAYHSMRLTSVDSSSGDGAEQCRQLIRRWG